MAYRALGTIASIGLCSLTMFALAFPLDCYFLQSSGCGSGASFCIDDTEVCDIGYSKTVDTGCGRTGPFLSSVHRSCYTITDTVTHPCDDDDEPSQKEVIGCHDGNGVCCYGTKTWTRDIGYMSEPSGAYCCDITVQ